uniref:Uncharacterized protein n=1 Tax=Plectus sambesii TaxID=2011161 RepID=A0A914WE79_9BILA
MADVNNTTTKSPAQSAHDTVVSVVSVVYVLVGILMVVIYACVLCIHGRRQTGWGEEIESPPVGMDFQRSNSLPPIERQLSFRRETVA